MALDYLVLDPVGTFHFPTWQVFLPLLPFLLSGVLIAILTAQREQTRHLAERAQKEAERYADEAEQDTILREIVLSLTADILQEKVSLLAQETAPCSVRQRLLVVSDLHATGDASSSETIDEQINLLHRLIADLPLLKAIRGSITLFDQSPPYDLYEIAQALIEEQRYGQNRAIDVQLLSPSVLFEQDAEQVSLILICLLQHALGVLPTTQGLSVWLGQDETTLIIQIGPANESHEPGVISPLDQRVFRNQADLWWLICQAGAKRQGGHMTFREEEQVWTVVLPRKKRPQTILGSTITEGMKEKREIL